MANIGEYRRISANHSPIFAKHSPNIRQKFANIFANIFAKNSPKKHDETRQKLANTTRRKTPHIRHHHSTHDARFANDVLTMPARSPPSRQPNNMPNHHATTTRQWTDRLTNSKNGSTTPAALRNLGESNLGESGQERI